MEDFGRGWSRSVTLLNDPEGLQAKRWSIRRVPTIVLVAGDGTVVWKGNSPKEANRVCLEMSDSRVQATI